MRRKYVAWREWDGTVVGVWMKKNRYVQVGSRQVRGGRVVKQILSGLRGRGDRDLDYVLDQLREMSFTIEPVRSFRRIVH